MKHSLSILITCFYAIFAIAQNNVMVYNGTGLLVTNEPDLILKIDVPKTVNRCADNYYTIHYEYKGVTEAQQAHLEVEFDKYITPTDCDLLWNKKDGKYHFDISPLKPGECGSIQIYTYIDCNAPLGEKAIAGVIGIYEDNLMTGPTEMLYAIYTDVAPLKRRVVTLNRYEENLAEQTVSTEVLTQKQLRTWHIVTIDQALHKVPGMNIIEEQADIRGGSGYAYGAGSRVLFLQDGLPMFKGDTGSPIWDFIPMENVGQVEIIKGAASSLYGSGALNGIVHVRTVEPTVKPKTNLSVFGTLYQNPRKEATLITDENGAVTDTVPKGGPPYESGFSFSHQQKYKRVDFTLGTHFIKQQGWIATQFANRGRIHLKTKYRLNPQLSAGINANIQFSEGTSVLVWNGTGANRYVAWKGADTVADSGIKLSIDPYMELLNERFNVVHKISGRYFRNNNENDKDKSTYSDLFFGDYQLQKNVTRFKGIFTAGASGTYIRAHGDLYMPNALDTTSTRHTSTNLALYAQADKQFFGRLNVSIGGRLEINEIDDVSDNKPVLRLGANYQATENTFLRASFGQGYRYPTIAEKFISTQFGRVEGGEGSNLSIPIHIYPNPDLKSEKGWSLEMGLKQGFHIGGWEGFIDVAGFINQYFNMTEFAFGSTFAGNEPNAVHIPENSLGFQAVNIGDAHIYGTDMTLSGSGKLGNVAMDMLVGYTLINPEYKNFDSTQLLLSSVNENVLKYRFRHTFKSDIQLVYKGFSLGVSAQHNSKMEAVDQAFEDVRPLVGENLVATLGITMPVGIPGLQAERQDPRGNWVVHARMAYQLNEHSTISLHGQNLANRAYTLRPALMEPPRSFTLRYSLNL